MNIKMMRLPPRRFSMPNNKRKERDDFDPKRLNPPTIKKLPKPASSLNGSDKAVALAQPTLSNQLLAGYLAHKFLTRRTLFGQTWDPARPQQTVIGGDEMDLKERFRPAEAEPKLEPSEEKRQSYVEVASLLKADGAHIPGIVNPSQLARFLKISLKGSKTQSRSELALAARTSRRSPSHMSCTDIRAPKTWRLNPTEWFDVAFHAEAQTAKRDKEEARLPVLTPNVKVGNFSSLYLDNRKNPVP